MAIDIPLKVGDTQTFSKTITEADVNEFAELTGDFSPFHTDEEYMKTTPYGTRIAHGMLTFSVSASASTLIHKPYDDEHPVTSYGYDHIRFTAPVFLGETITCTYTIERVEPETGKTYADVTVTNQDGTVVCVAKHILKFLA